MNWTLCISTVLAKRLTFFISYFKLQKDNDKDHKVRLAIGNGIREEIWKEFLNRFGNIQIREFYASTEGNVGFLNYVGKIGAIGRVHFFHQVKKKNPNSNHSLMLYVWNVFRFTKYLTDCLLK